MEWKDLIIDGYGRVRLVSVMSDNLQHAGQVVYLCGLRKGRGWWESVKAIGS